MTIKRLMIIDTLILLAVAAAWWFFAPEIIGGLSK